MVQERLTLAAGALPIHAVAEEFLIACEVDRECSPRTLAGYRQFIGYFIRWLEESGRSLALAQIDLATLREYRLYLRRPVRWGGQGRAGRPMADSTRAAYERHLRVFFAWAVRDAGYLDADPYAGFAKVKVPRKPMRFLTEPELAAVWQTFNSRTRRGQRDRALFLLLLDTSVRVSELCAITLADVDLANGTITIHGKGGHIRHVGMSPRTIAQVAGYARRWRQPADFPELLLHATKWKPLERWAVRMILDRWAREAQVDPFSPHAFRRTSATRAIAAGADGLTVAAQMGHVSLTMTQRYVQAAGLDLGKLRREHSPLKGLKF